MILDLWHEERLDDLERLVLTVPLNDPKAYLLAADHELRWNGRRFYIAEVDDRRDGSRPTRTVEAFALWYRLNDPTYVGSLVLDNRTPAAGLAEILTGTGWTVHATSTTTSTEQFDYEAQDRTPLAMVREWARVTGTSVVFDTSARTVALVESRGANRGMQFRYGRNLRRVRRTHRPPDATRLYPYGANGLTIAGLNGGLQYLEDFTYYTAQGLTIDEARARFTRTRVWQDSKLLTDAALLAAAEGKLAELAAGETRYELQVVILAELTGVPEPVEVGDRVGVVDDELGVDLTTTVVRRRRFPLQPWRDEVELGTLPDLWRSDAPSTRDPFGDEWQMFVDDLAGGLVVRNDAQWIAGRIPLRFRTGGEAHWHLDVFATGVGSGTLVVDVWDELTASNPHRPLRIPFTDGELVHGSLTFAEQNRSGAYDYRARVTTDGGGVDLAAADLRFYVLARGAVQETPTFPESETFEYTGAVQLFTVPDSVNEITITARAAAGGLDTSTSAGTRAGGAVVTATLPVTPGQTLDVYVGGQPVDGSAGGGWPDGGNGDAVSGANGHGGGGSTRVVPNGAALASALIVAGAGGGQGQGFFGGAKQSGGAGGMFAGADGVPAGPDGGLFPGGGATQSAGGAGGGGSNPGSAGAFGQGGNAGDAINSFTFPPGGGGGGWDGGGGGGSSYVHPSGYAIEFEDGGNAAGHGQVVISWRNPD